MSETRGNYVENRLVAVCSECLRASCWQGASPCPESKWACMIQKSVSELVRLGYEDAAFWILFTTDED